MNVQILKVTTMGTPVEDLDYPNINAGYDNIDSFFMVVPIDFDDFDPENTRSLELVCELNTIGM